MRSDEEMQDLSEEQDEADDGQPSSDNLSDEGVHDIHDATDKLGGQDAIALRHRLLALVGCIPYVPYAR